MIKYVPLSCITNNFQRKSCFVFCDFLKDFDKVYHRGLIWKLNAYCIDRSLLHCQEDYLH